MQLRNFNFALQTNKKKPYLVRRGRHPLCPASHLQSGPLLPLPEQGVPGVLPGLEGPGALAQGVLHGANQGDVVLQELEEVVVVGLGLPALRRKQ